MRAKGRSIESVGERIHRLRHERGLTLRRLAGPGVSASYICHLERGDRRASVKALRVIAAGLGVSPEYLETGVEPACLESRLADAELELRLGTEPVGDRFAELLLEAGAAGDAAGELRAKLGLILARIAAGEHEEAVRAFEGLERRPAVAERPDVYAAVGRAYALAGETPRAVGHLRGCLAEIDGAPVRDAPLFVRFASYLSYALTDVGDVAGANLVLSDALRRAEKLADPFVRIRLSWSLARLYGVQGPPELALRYYRQAIELLQTTDDRLYLGRAHEACGSALLDQGAAEDAREHLESAEEIYRDFDEGALLGSVRVEWARFHLEQGDVELARGTALGALDLLDAGSADADDVGDAWRVLGDVLARAGEPEIAERAYSKAIESLVGSGAPVKYLADAYRSYAGFLHGQGRDEEAYEQASRAMSLTGTPRGDPVKPPG